MSDRIEMVKRVSRQLFSAKVMVVAVLAGGGYLLYKGYLASEGNNQSASNHGLRIFPTATASTRGIVAEFDF